MVKRVLVTGAAGFVAHHLIEELLKNSDYEVVALARVNCAGNLHRLFELDCLKDISVANRLKVVYHDLQCEVSEPIAERIGKIDFVFHLAANSHVDRSIKEPMLFVKDTVVGSVNLFEWARKGLNPGGRILNFGTDEIFGPAPGSYAFKEEDAWRPSNPYSAAKTAQLAFGNAYFVTYGLPIINTFTVNIFGERQNPEKFLPMCMKRIRDGVPIQIHSKLGENGEVEYVGVRNWIHARNVANALVFLVEKGVPGEYYNVCAFDEYDNAYMAKLIGKFMGKEPVLEYVDFHKQRPGHDRRYCLDGSKLRSMGWKPPVSFEDSMKKMVEWTLANPSWFNG